MSILLDFLSENVYYVVEIYKLKNLHMDKFIPSLEFVIDQNKDIEEIAQFAKEGDQFILDFFPQLKNVAEKELESMVARLVIDAHGQHEKELKNKLDFLKNQQQLLLDAMRRMSVICEEDWSRMGAISIVLGVNPIAPRNLQEKYFSVPVYESNETLLAFCAHELLHFIYFKKWHAVFSDSIETYEYPHATWVLSEILAPVVLSDAILQKIIPSSISLYPHWEEFDKKHKIIETFKKRFDERLNFIDFLKKSIDEYEKMDKEFSLTQLLTK